MSLLFGSRARRLFLAFPPPNAGIVDCLDHLPGQPLLEPVELLVQQFDGVRGGAPRVNAYWHRDAEAVTTAARHARQRGQTGRRADHAAGGHLADPAGVDGFEHRGELGRLLRIHDILAIRKHHGDAVAGSGALAANAPARRGMADPAAAAHGAALGETAEQGGQEATTARLE